MNRRNLLTALTLAPVAAHAQALPPPPHGRPGLVRLGGTPGMAAVATAWARAFETANPGIRVETRMFGSDIAMAGLYSATCDIALIGREATKPEIQAFEWVYRTRPRGLAVLAGSVATPGRSPALAVLAHSSNPIESIDMAGLRAVFGEAGRDATWGRLGLSGKWSNRPINLYSPDAESGTGRFFRAAVLDGSNRMAWTRLREFPVPPRPEVAEARAMAALRAALGRDMAGLAVGVAPRGRERVKLVPIIGANGIARLPDADSIASGAYPLARTVLAYHPITREGATAHAESLKMLRFLATREAQRLATEVSDYLALPDALLAHSRRALG